MEESSTSVASQQMEGGYKYIKKHKISYKWQVSNMSSRLEPSQDKDLILSTSEFTSGSQKNDKWRLRMYFNNGPTPQNSADNVTVVLENLNVFSVAIVVSSFVVNNKQENLFVENCIHVFVPKHKTFIRHFIKKDLLAQKSELMPSDILTACVEVVVLDNKETVPIEASLNVSKRQLVEDLKDVYHSRVSSDVTIIIEDKQFEAHKIILMARSPVLAAMFTHDMTEKKSNEVSISDITPEIFEKLLEYIYTDQVTDLDLVAADLLEAADKYQLQSLKKMCEVSLCKNLHCDNAIEMMILADRYNATNLLKYVTKCFIADSENIIKSEGFRKMEKSSIAFELLKSVIAFHANNGTEIVYSS